MCRPYERFNSASFLVTKTVYLQVSLECLVRSLAFNRLNVFLYVCVCVGEAGMCSVFPGGEG